MSETADDENQTALLKQQKQDAINKLKSLRAVCLPKNIEDITKDLNQGKVPPIFHALARLSNVNEGNKQPTSDAVSVGEYSLDESGQPLRLDEEATNFHEVIDDQGIPCSRIKDGVYFWAASRIYPAAVCDLVNNKAEMLGNGVEGTALTSNFSVDITLLAHQDMYLLTRSESRGVVTECFKVENTSAIIGSPGVGKSWTLLYALQQALLYDMKVVLFFECKVSMAYLFYRQENIIHAWSRDHTPTVAAASRLFRRADVLVLYDPPETITGGGATFSIGRCQLIVAMSANEKHDFQTNDKAIQGTGVECVYLGMPSSKELQAMIPKMTDDPVDVALEQAESVGNLPRYIIKKRYLINNTKKWTKLSSQFTMRTNFFTF
jgi:hypothetical protein